MRRLRVFYGWRIVAAGFVLETLVGALLMHSFGAYVVVLREEFGWSKTLLSAAFSMARAESGFLGPLQGWLIDRLGPRTLIRIGVLVFAVGFFLFSQFRSPVGFFATFFLLALGSSLGGWMPVGVALVHWFRRRRALALSISATGMAVGGLLTPVVTLALTHLGWRWTAALSGLVVLAVGLPAAQVIRHRPEPYGYAPDGDPAPLGPGRPAAGAAHGGRSNTALVDFTAREALGTSAFWYIALGHGSALLVVSALMVHLVAHVTERLGYSLQQAAAVVALMTVAQVVGQVGGGWAGDRWSKRAIVVGCMAAHATALVVLASASARGLVVGAAVLHGLAWGIRGPLMSAIRADYFGGTAFGAITGFASMIVMLGMTAGPLIAGVLADRTGSYEVGFRILAALAAIGSVFFVLARPPAPPRRA